MSLNSRLKKLEEKSATITELPITFFEFWDVDGTSEIGLAILPSINGEPGARIEKVEGETDDEFVQSVEMQAGQA